MSNINDIKTIYGAVYALGLLAILALGLLIVPIQTEAAQNYVFDSSVNINSNFPSEYNTANMNYVPNTYTYRSPTAQVTPIYYPVATVQPSYYTVPTIDSTKAVAKSTTTASTAKKSVATTSTTNKTVTATDNKYESLAAGAIFGTSNLSFLPSGLLQWILFAILILIIVILARRVFGGTKRFLQMPLKHA